MEIATVVADDLDGWMISTGLCIMEKSIGSNEVWDQEHYWKWCWSASTMSRAREYQNHGKQKLQTCNSFATFERLKIWTLTKSIQKIKNVTTGDVNEALKLEGWKEIKMQFVSNFEVVSKNRIVGEVLGVHYDLESQLSWTKYPLAELPFKFSWRIYNSHWSAQGPGDPNDWPFCLIHY